MAGVSDTTATSANAPTKAKKRSVIDAVKRISPEKAKLMLGEGSIRGKPLTEHQKGLFGMIAGRAKK